MKNEKIFAVEFTYAYNHIENKAFCTITKQFYTVHHNIENEYQASMLSSDIQSLVDYVKEFNSINDTHTLKIEYSILDNDFNKIKTLSYIDYTLAMR